MPNSIDGEKLLRTGGKVLEVAGRVSRRVLAPAILQKEGTLARDDISNTVSLTLFEGVGVAGVVTGLVTGERGFAQLGAVLYGTARAADVGVDLFIRALDRIAGN